MGNIDQLNRHTYTYSGQVWITYMCALTWGCYSIRFRYIAVPTRSNDWIECTHEITQRSQSKLQLEISGKRVKRNPQIGYKALPFGWVIKNSQNFHYEIPAEAFHIKAFSASSVNGKSLEKFVSLISFFKYTQIKQAHMVPRNISANPIKHTSKHLNFNQVVFRSSKKPSFA